jgi:hypothetical protein
MKLDPIVERACTWSLNTIIWSYHSAVIIQTGIKEEGRKFQSKELKKLLDHISKGHIPYQQSLLTYLVYYLGACFENFKINNIKKKVDDETVENLINAFFDNAKRYSKDKSIGHQPCIIEVNNKKYDFNKKIINAHLPKLTKADIKSITSWFVNNYKTAEPISKIFIGAGHYFNLENTGYMNQVAGPGKSNTTALLELLPGHFEKFVGTGLRKDVALRLSYLYMNEAYSPRLHEHYVDKASKKSKNVLKYAKGEWIKYFYLRASSSLRMIEIMFTSGKPGNKKDIKDMVKEMSRMDFLDIIYLCSRKIALSENEKEKNNLLIIRDLIEEYRLKTK